MTTYWISTLRVARSSWSALVQLLGVGLVLVAPCLFFDAPLNALSPERRLAILWFAASYLTATLLFIARERAGRNTNLGTLLACLAVAYAPTLLFLLLEKSTFSRAVILFELGIGVFFALNFRYARRWPRWRALPAVLAILAAVSIQTGFALGALPRPEPPLVVTQHISTALYDLKVNIYQNSIPLPAAKGGGLAQFGERYLLGTGDGNLYAVSERSSGSGLLVEPLAYRVPENAAEFFKAAGTSVEHSWFRTADILTQTRNGKLRLFATHHYWKVSEQCFVMRVSLLEGLVAEFTDPRSHLSWRTVFETTPCVPIVYPGRANYFGGIQAGGRLTLLGDDELLVSIGDNGLDGWNVPVSMPQNPQTSYGKTIHIDLVSGKSDVFSIGHRNPQGLFADSASGIWLTEHGPQGGDELNHIERGANYGYPLVTYGVEYGTHSWPFDPVAGNHDGFTQPYYSWLPSIGVSNLLVIHSPKFSLWDGDLLVASLVGRTLFRLRVRDQRVVMMEAIRIGDRIRDIEQGHAGELLLLTDSASVMSVRVDNEDTQSGEVLFARCAGCHTIADGSTHGFGPDLFHIVGRRVASAPGFQYSAAMQQRGGVWTQEQLDTFLANPQAAVPGTAMQFSGIPDQTTRARLVEFLVSNKPFRASDVVDP